jgi:Domain of unknown function (DUF5664)
MSKGEVVQPSSTGGQKAGNNVRAGLLPWAELMEVAELYGQGAAKYEANNWMKGYEWSKSFDAMTRHLSESWLGNEFDDGEGGTGQEHLDCVIFHALALKYFRKHFPQFDDRPVTWAKQQAEEPKPLPWLVLTEDDLKTVTVTWTPEPPQPNLCSSAEERRSTKPRVGCSNHSRGTQGRGVVVASQTVTLREPDRNRSA